MSFLDTRHKKKSFTLTTALLSALLLLLFYIGLTYLDPPEEKGIAINFGTTEFGSGKVQPKRKVPSKPVKTPQKPITKQEEIQEDTGPKEAPVEKVLTQEREESIRIRQQEIEKQKAQDAARKAKAAAERIAREKKEAEERERREQQDKKNKLDELIDGIKNSDGPPSTSEGNDTKPGDEGNPYATSHYGPGAGNGAGGGYGLNGRSLVSRGKVQQDCNEEGRVVVEIVVDKNGKVIKATPGKRGTTNTHPCLYEPARKTAFKHRWNLDAKAPNQQIGFVVVNFKLGE